jgi:hypothetical protein
MLATSPPSTRRRALASLSLGASAVGVGWLAVSVARYFEPSMVALALAISATIGVAALGLSRRSVLTQVLSRGVAWVVLTPALLGLADSLGHGHLPDRYVLLLAATSASALVLARPALHTDAAKAEFFPVAYRSVFLAGAVASVMTAAVVALFAVDQVAWGQAQHALFLAAFTAALLASAVGVVRMRAWGVVLGMVTSAVALEAAFLSLNETLGVLALAAIPGTVLASPLVAARLRRPRRATRVMGELPSHEVATEEAVDTGPPILARIGVVAEPEGEELPDPVVRLAVGQK